MKRHDGRRLASAGVLAVAPALLLGLAACGGPNAPRGAPSERAAIPDASGLAESTVPDPTTRDLDGGRATASGHARAWEAWPTWGYLEASSLAARVDLEDRWGGLLALARAREAGRGLSLVPLDDGADGAFAVTRAALGKQIDEALPTRTVVTAREGGRLSWAMIFGARSPEAPLPLVCRSGRYFATTIAPVVGVGGADPCAACTYVHRGGGATGGGGVGRGAAAGATGSTPASDDRAIVCGEGDAERALREDFLARGLRAATPNHVHVEESGARGVAAPRATFDATVDAQSLVASLRVTPHPPIEARPFSSDAMGAAAHVLASPRVEVGAPRTAFDTELLTPLAFAPFTVPAPVVSEAQTPAASTTPDPLAGGKESFSDHDLVFVEKSVAATERAMSTYWKKVGPRSRALVEVRPAPQGFPPGTRRDRVRVWSTDTGEELLCTPGAARGAPGAGGGAGGLPRKPLGGGGGCRVVARHAPRTTLDYDDDVLFVPESSGTWIARAGSTQRVVTLRALLVARKETVPSPWLAAAMSSGTIAVGTSTTRGASLAWRDRVDGGEVLTEMEGTAHGP